MTVTWCLDLSDVLLKVVTLLDDFIDHVVHSKSPLHVPTDKPFGHRMLVIFMWSQDDDQTGLFTCEYAAVQALTPQG